MWIFSARSSGGGSYEELLPHSVTQQVYHGPAGWWIVEGKHSGVFHGVGLLLPMPDGNDVEVGYRLARRSWGCGLATEAGAALIHHAFAALALPRVVAVVYRDNHPSRRVLSKLGFAHDGLREYRGARVEHFVLPVDAWCRRVDNPRGAPS
jgi:RimJ/RimL family protein N-acetyltransferase